MQTKLTLRLDAGLIERAKSYSRSSGKSLSRLVADYFDLLTRPEEAEEDPLPPITRALSGSLKTGSLKTVDAEPSVEDYHRYLEDKYLESRDR